MLAQTLMGLVDTLFMGWVSTAAQGAVGLGNIVVWTFSSLFVGTLTVVNTYVAQHHGAVEYRQCGAIAWQGIWLSFLFSIAVMAAAGYLPELVQVFASPPAVESITIGYAKIRTLGLPLAFLDTTLTSFMRGIGDTRTPMKVAVATVLINIPLNYWLIFGGFGIAPMGPNGAAWATVISLGLGALVLLALFWSPSLRNIYSTAQPRVRGTQLLSLLKVGAPIGLAWLLEMATWSIFTVVVSRFGEVSLAAHNIALQALHLSFMPGVGMSVAATTLVGQYLGAGDPDGARRAGAAVFRLTLGYMVGMAVVFVLGGRFIAGAFSADLEVAHLAYRLFLWAAAFQAFDAMGISSSGILRGAGDTTWPMIFSVGFAWLVFMPLLWLFGFYYGWGVEGTWASATVYIMGLGASLFIRVRRGRWLSRSLLKEDPNGVSA